MRKYLKYLLLAVLCLSLLAAVGCGKKDAEPADTTTGTTTVPQETTEGTVPEETTTEKPVNIVEDPLNNGEGDPTDAMDSTNPAEEDKPGVDIEIDDGNTGNTGNGNTGNGNTGNTGNTGNGNTGNTGNTGNSGNTNTGDTENGDGDDDFVIDFDDLT